MNRENYILEKLGGQFNSNGRLHTRCPFHDDASPSFSINTEGLFICGGCGRKGNFPKFMKLIENLSWKEVYARLERPHVEKLELNTSLGRQKKQEEKVFDFPVKPFVEPINHIRYLEERNLGRDVIDAFGLVFGRFGFFGVDISDSLVFPIFDLSGVYKSFQIRRLKPARTRWDNPVGSQHSRYLYGGWLVGSSDFLWIVEGASDVWRLYAGGVTAVGLFTKNASSAQMNLIYELCRMYGSTPVICLDGDAGEKHISRIAKDLSAYGLSPRRAILSLDEDPGNLSNDRLEFLKKELKDGREAGAIKNVDFFEEGRSSVF